MPELPLRAPTSPHLCLTLVIAALLCGCAARHPENPALDEFPPGVAGSTDVTYYDIHGRTAQELLADMRRLGPSNGRFIGETQSPMRWTYRTRSSGMNCEVTSAQITVHSAILLPRWTPPDTVPGLLAQWKQFLAALETHEIGHKNISGRSAQAILRKLYGINTECSQLSAEAKRVTDAIVVAAQAEQAKYDADTQHGLTQGAVFPPLRASQP